MNPTLKRMAIAGASTALALAAACTGTVEGSVPPTISPDIFAPIPTPRPFGQKPTPTATPFLLPVPAVAVTATFVPTATLVPTATPIATIGAPGPEPTSEASPTPTATALPLPTFAPEFTATPEPVAEPTATPEPTATATPTPVSSAPGGVVFSLTDSSIFLDPGNFAPESVAAGVSLSQFSATATFGNPVNPTFRAYSYGIKFRQDGGDYQVISIDSSGSVQHRLFHASTDGGIDTYNVLQDFDYDDVKLAASDFNTLHLTVIDDLGWLYVNGTYITEFPVPGVGVSSDVEFIAELENETNISGAQTELPFAEVRRAIAASFSPSESLVKEAGEIARTTQTGTLRDSVITAEFVSPYVQILGRWSVGFEYTNPETGTTNWFIFNNRRQWKHVSRSVIDGELVEHVAGLSDLILRHRDDVNELRIVGTNGTHQVFLNGVYLAQLTFTTESFPVHGSAIAGFESTDQAPGIPTVVNSYTAWSLGE